MRHLIKKQIIDLTLRKKQDAFRMQQLASENYYHNMLPIIDKQFTDFSSDDEVIQIDRLEIELGDISEKQLEQLNWDADLATRLGQLVKEVLQQHIRQKQLVRQAMPAAFCGQWLFYMEKGYLPWNTVQANKEWRNKALETLAIDFKAVSALRSLIGQNRNAVIRIVMQHEDLFLLRVAEVLTAEKQSDLPAAIDEIYILFRQLAKSGLIPELHLPEKKVFRQTIWSHILTISASGDKDLTETKLITRVLQLQRGLFKEAKKIPAAVLANLNIVASIVKDLEKSAEASSTKMGLHPVDGKDKQKPLNNNINSTGKTASQITQNMTDEDSGTGEADLLKTGNEFLDKEENTSPDPVPGQIDEDGVFVVNAGIVLLHPFLSAFFRRIELVKDTVFVDPSAKQKALYLLHYLATGQMEAEEHELVLPKILCEWPLYMPVKKEISIGSDGYEEALCLLESAVSQWEILKNSSVAGLREGFLKRPGKVFIKNENLYLQVESNSIDILLDHLPWNLSIIKLPWMKEILRVEWR